MRPSARIIELAERLTSPGHAPSKLSASEFNELADTVSGWNAIPKIVCLCGSTRFHKTFREQSLRLAKEGKIVLSIGAASGSDAEHLADGTITKADKEAFDELHKRKIDLCDEVLVLNVGGYIGESTRSEIEHAKVKNKPITYLYRTNSLVTGVLGFRLEVVVAIGEFPNLGEHRTYEDSESGKVASDAIHRISIKADLDPAALPVIVAHEVYHLFHSVRHLIKVDEETESEAFGELVGRVQAFAQNQQT